MNSCQFREEIAPHINCKAGVFYNPSPTLCDQCFGKKMWESRKEKPLPSKAKMAVNFSQAVVTDIATGRQRRSVKEAETILEAFCKGNGTACEWYRPSDKRCAACGCYLEKKVAWKSQHCPMNKW